MKALEILDKLIQKVFWLDRYRRPGKPGDMINTLSDEERKELNNLSSDETKELTNPGAPHAPYWCDDFYHRRDADKQMSDAKLEFDKKNFKK